MTHDSSTGGYLAPGASPAPLEDDQLTAFLQKMFAGLSGIDGALVRPRWQSIPPNQPDIATNWLAIGIQNRSADTFAFEMHDPNAAGGNGADIVNRNEQLDILCSFYGPQAAGLAARVREGFAVPQNREALQTAGMALVECTDLIAAPALINERWYRRYDMTVRIRRAVTRIYPVLHLLTAGIVLHTDVGITETIDN
jgi:hypothetical protein